MAQFSLLSAACTVQATFTKDLTPKPAYKLEADTTVVDETINTLVSVTLTVENVDAPDIEYISFAIVGTNENLTAEDFGWEELTGVFSLCDYSYSCVNSATLDFIVATDTLTEGEEVFKVYLDGGFAEAETAEITIIDTSTSKP